MINLELLSLPSHLAYLGPGLAAGSIAVVLGVIGSIFLAIFGVVYYPLKRAIKRRKQQRGTDHES